MFTVRRSTAHKFSGLLPCLVLKISVTKYGSQKSRAFFAHCTQEWNSPKMTSSVTLFFMDLRDIYFLRHGACDNGAQKLNDRGLQQTRDAMQFLREKLQGLSVQIHSSPGPCAMESAQMISDNFNTDMRVHDWLVKLTEEESFNFSVVVELLKKLKECGRPMILITNGKFLQAFTKALSEQWKFHNPLYDLERGNVVLLWIDQGGNEIKFEKW